LGVVEVWVMVTGEVLQEDGVGGGVGVAVADWPPPQPPMTIVQAAAREKTTNCGTPAGVLIL
jgi:hypothetical protein